MNEQAKQAFAQETVPEAPPVPKPVRSLVRKVSEIIGEIERVAKNGRNDFHRYDYATESDIAAAVRSGMAKRGLAMFPSVEKTEWSVLETGKGGKLRLCTLTVCFTLEDAESGETRQFRIIGEGSDSGDKATYKAMTGAEKYALMKLFLIPTGDDPEQEDAPKSAPRPAVREVTNPETGEVAADPEPASAAQEQVLMPFGTGKGKAPHELDAKSLAWYAKVSQENADDPAKSKYRAGNLKLVDALKAEFKRRQTKKPAAEDNIPF